MDGLLFSAAIFLSGPLRKTTAHYCGEPPRSKEFHPCRREGDGAMSGDAKNLTGAIRLIADSASVIVRAH